MKSNVGKKKNINSLIKQHSEIESHSKGSSIQYDSGNRLKENPDFEKRMRLLDDDLVKGKKRISLGEEHRRGREPTTMMDDSCEPFRQ
jgi:hypothetical protein